MAQGTIVVGNLKTSEKYFDHFVVELHLDNSGLNKLASQPAKGLFNSATLLWSQTELIQFTNCNAGQTYYLRAGVVDSGGNEPTWSGWVAATAVDLPENLVVPTTLNFMKWRGDWGAHADKNDLADFIVQSMVRKEDSTTGGQITMHQTFPHANVAGDTILVFIYTENQDASGGFTVQDSHLNNYNPVAFLYSPSTGQAEHSGGRRLISDRGKHHDLLFRRRQS